MAKKFQLQAFKSPADQAFSFEATVSSSKQGLDLTFLLDGPCNELRIPPPHPTPSARDELWKTTCFEIFTQWPGASAYEEWNFGPDGCWAHYYFEGYRQRDSQVLSQAPLTAPHFSAQAEQLRMDVTIPWPERPKQLKQDELAFGLSGILHFSDDKRQYWALKHAAENPDFHDARSFTGRL